MFSTTHGEPSVTLAHLKGYVIDTFGRNRAKPNVRAPEVEADGPIDIETIT